MKRLKLIILLIIAAIPLCISGRIFSNAEEGKNNLNNISISWETDGFRFTPDKKEYNIYPDYSVSSLKVTVTSDEQIDVNGQALKSGESAEILLNIGYTCIDVTLNGPTDSTHYYIHVHRANDPDVLYREQFRSQVHISTKDCLLNDPNGLLYDAYKGEYHLFCQYSPKTSFATEDKAWCHLVSKDLVHWEELGLAVLTDELGEAWSGSGVIDRDNTSGLFDDSVPPESRMVLIYTSAKGDRKYGTEKVSLAYSKDFGRTWIKYEGNPVIKNGDNYQEIYTGGFRDPKVIRYEEENVWLALVGGGNFRLFTSDDLINWKEEGVCYDTTGRRIINAECPDIFRLKVEGTDEYLWVCVGSDYNNGDSKILYYPGNLERGEEGKIYFTAIQKRKNLFEGGTVYSTTSFFNDKDGRKISASWVREWLFSEGTDGPDVKNWAGLISWPLELKLVKEGDDYILKSLPVSEMESLRNETLLSLSETDVTSGANPLSDIQCDVFELIAAFSPDSDFTFDLRGIKYSYSRNDGTLTVDASGVNGGNRVISVTPKGGKIHFRIIVDKSNTAVYVNNGDSSDYVIGYPTDMNMSLAVSEGSVHFDEITVYSLKSIWFEDAEIPEDEPAETGAAKSGNKLLTVLVCVLGAVFLLVAGFVVKELVPKKKK